MSDINDQVATAIQAYAQTIPNPEFKLNLLAAAEHMAPALIKELKLKQEWAVVNTYRYQASDDPTDLCPEEVESIDDVGEDPSWAFNELERRRERNDPNDDRSRDYVATRAFTEWAEVHPIILNADEQKQMDIDQGVIPA